MAITNEQFDSWFEKFNNIFKPIIELGEKEMEIAAIWLENAIILPNGKREYRMAPGMEIYIKDGKPAGGTATHKIIGCYGNINNTSLKMTVISLLTNLPEIIILK